MGRVLTNPYMAAEHDLPAAETVACRYAVLSLPRSGSTFFCRALWNTGVAGRPAEYLNTKNMADLFSRWGSIRPLGIARRLLHGRVLKTLGIGPKTTTWRSLDLSEYFVQLLAHRTTANGVFGTKVHFSQVQDLLSERELTLDRYLAPLSYLYVERRDRLRQAISHLRAEQSGSWSHLEPAVRQPQYDFETVRTRLARITTDKELLERYFETLRIEPLVVPYEELVEDYAGTVRRALQFIGVADAGQVEIAPPTMKRQSDDLTEEWIERYRSDSARSNRAQ